MKRLSIELKNEDQKIVTELQQMGWNMSALVRQLLRDKYVSLGSPIMFGENEDD